ncbi:MAG: DNA-directed RNA polymerase subunit D [archaeon]
MSKLEVVSDKNNKMTFLLKNSSPAYSNALRRIMLTEVPVMAIEEVEISKNSSAMYDEVLAHRLGLLPLTTDLDSYELPTGPEDIESRKAKCTLTLTLKEKGPKTVYASDMKTGDPKVKPVFPKMQLVKLLKEQEIELIAVAVLGRGSNHAKFSPGHIWYNYDRKLKIGAKKDLEKYKDMYPPQIFNKKGEVDEDLILKNNLVDAVAHINENIIKVEYSDKDYVFQVESWGQLPCKKIVEEALNIFNSKLDELGKLVK